MKLVGHDRPRRGRRAQSQGGRERPAHLREPEPRPHGRRAQVGRRRASAATRACARTTTRRRCATAGRTWTRRRARWRRASTAWGASSRRRSTSFTSRRRSTTGCSTARSSSSTRTRTTGRAPSAPPSRRSRFTLSQAPAGRRGRPSSSASRRRTASPASSRASARRCTRRRSSACYAQYLVPVQGQADILVYGHPVHQPVQRELVPEPAARAGDGAGVPLQPVPGRAAREEGRHDDRLPPVHRPVRQGAPRSVHRVRARRAPADARRGGDAQEVRGEVRDQPGVHRDVPQRATPTTPPTRSSCGTGARPGGSTSGASSSSAPTTTTSRSSSAGRRRATFTEALAMAKGTRSATRRSRCCTCRRS